MGGLELLHHRQGGQVILAISHIQLDITDI